MTEILILKSEVVATSELKVDGKNPNRMTRPEIDRLKTSFETWGFIVPIITNKDLLIADGEQRWTAAKELGMKEVSVVRLPVEDVDRRLLRQVLNKLKGTHDRAADAEEFELIIELGKEDDLKYLLNLSDDKLDGYLKEPEPIEYEKKYQVAVDCKDEIDMEALTNRLTSEGRTCHPLIL
jgi:ParB-like chromosome segregation protein Spo0J